MLVHFSTDEAADIAKVGGKAASLISLQQSGANDGGSSSERRCHCH